MTGPTHATPEVAEAAPQVEAPVPAMVAGAPVPLMVGHAEDRAEHDADAMADTALSRLRRLEGDTHTHGPGCDHSQVRRSAAPPSGAPVVGYEGGALDSGTSSAIESSRGGGRALDADVRRRMETAFSRDFSSVRIHDDAKAAKLNSAVSATAFTTGKDIFFGSKQYAPGTPGGDRVLAHELAHTLQPDGGPRRQVATAPGVSPRAHAAVMRGIAASHTIQRWPWSKKVAPAPAAAPAAAPQTAGFKGKAGSLPSTTAERTKGGIVGGVVGGAQAAGTFAAGAAPMLGGLTGGAAGLLTTGDALMGLNNADSMMTEAAEFGDAGMWNLAGRKGKNQGMQALTGAAAMAKGGVEMAYLASAGKSGVMDAMVAGAGNATLGAAAGGLGIATGSVQVLQGLWRGGKAVQKLARLSWGRGAKTFSAAGKRWKEAILGAEKFKLGMSAVKTALGILGIAAGALLIVSNPIGWGIGIAAAIAGGIAAGIKINAKINDAKNRAKISQEILASGDAVGSVSSAAGTSTKAPAAATKSAGAKKLSERERSEEEKQRLKAIEHANEVGRRASEYAVVAAEMRDALRNDDRIGGDGPGKKSEYLVKKTLETVAQYPQFDPATVLAPESNAEKYDAYQLLSSINVTDDEALADSGQDLIEKKLSKMEAM